MKGALFSKEKCLFTFTYEVELLLY